METLKQDCLYSCGSGGSGLLLHKNVDDYMKLTICSFEISDPDPISQTTLPIKLQSISLGGIKALGLSSTGNAYEWGEIGTNHDQKDNIVVTPIPLKSWLNRKVVKIACGWSHSLLLTDDMKVYAWGDGKFGQVGLGKQNLKIIKKPELLDLKDIQHVSMIHCGFRQSYIVANHNKTLLVFGANRSCELGLQTEESIISEPLIHSNLPKELNHIGLIASGQKFMMIMTELGELYACGDNKYGQLGLDKSIKGLFSLMKITLPLGVIAKQVACGWNHTLILSASNQVWITGRGDFGQQGNKKFDHQYCFHLLKGEHEPKEYREILTGSESCYASDSNNDLYGWGWNEHGNLSLGRKGNIAEPTKIQLPSMGNYTVYTGGAALMVMYT